MMERSRVQHASDLIRWFPFGAAMVSLTSAFATGSWECNVSLTSALQRNSIACRSHDLFLCMKD